MWIRIFFRIRIQEAKILRIQRIRILSTEFKRISIFFLLLIDVLYYYVLNMILFRTLEDVKRNADTVHLADCQRVSETGQLTNCFLLLTRTHLTTLVNGGSEDKLATVSSHHLSTIVKITSKKRQPEVITFKYGTSNKEEVTVFDMDR